MHGKRGLDRASYDTDIEFERAVDIAASQLGADGQLHLLHSLMRDCRACGAEIEPGKVEIRSTHPMRSWLVCIGCGHNVQLPHNGGHSLGKLVTLWNDTPLTIEAEVAHV